MRTPEPTWWSNETEARAIDALLTHVEESYRQKCAKLLRGDAVTFAQGWQDWYLWHNIFKRTPSLLEWGGGFYVDLGTNSPTIVSNTLFFE